jgi:hypothetical protein
VALVRVPADPFDDQIIPVLFVTLAPVVISTALAVEQMEIAVPASAVGAGVIVTVLLEVASTAHGEFAKAVKVRVTLPAVISPALGV